MPCHSALIRLFLGSPVTLDVETLRVALFSPAAIARWSECIIGVTEGLATSLR